MGKRIIQQARGKGSLTYRVRKKAYNKKIAYPPIETQGEAEIIAIIHSAAHSAPLMKVQIKDKTFYNAAFNTAYVGQKISLGFESNADQGNVLPLGKIAQGTEIYNIERNPGDGGKMIRTAGSFAVTTKKLDKKVTVTMPNKKVVTLNENCRATIGKIAGDGKYLKPFVKAGKKFHKMKARSKLYPKVSAVAVNAVDHPFGSGRGKNVGSKIAKRDASPGRKVGHLRPRRTGYRK